MRRFGRLAWGAFIVALAGILLLVYRRYVLAAGADGAFRWLRDGIHYQLLEPSALGVLLVTPVLLFVLGRSL
ncbi:MAG TPA: hypothetical protein VF294_17460, partial [Polyangiaceae bacterium]